MASNIRKMVGKVFCLSFLLWQPMGAQESCCDPCEWECSNRFHVNAEFLYWKIKNSPDPIPLLVTAPVAHNGDPLIGQPGTVVVLGGRSIRNNWRAGGRFTLGYQWDDAGCFGAEVNYFFLPSESRGRTVFSSGLPGSIFLSVPYFDTTTGKESSSPVAAPNQFSGLATLKLANRMQGAELNGLAAIFSNCSWNIKALAGFRYWNFNEHLKFFVNSPAVNIPKEIFLVKDRFHTENNFYGGQLGLGADYVCSQFFISAKGKIALGAMCEEVKIRGKFITNAFDGFKNPQSFSGGYFALPSNIGRHKRTTFAVIPEVTVNIGYQIADCWHLQVGYTFLYVNQVLWAGKQIKRKINPTQSSLYEFTATPTPTGRPSPKASLRSESLWVQGINIGLEFQF